MHTNKWEWVEFRVADSVIVSPRLFPKFPVISEYQWLMP
jgi:hypothetical protein